MLDIQIAGVAMPTQSVIESQIRSQFPILFELKDAVPRDEFMPKYNALVAYATKAAEPKLTTETSKSQWVLISSALFLLTLVLFQVGSLKFGETAVKVDAAVLVGYSAFVAALLITFLARAMLDLYRAKLAGLKDQDVAADLCSAVDRGVHERVIESFYWFELFNEAGKSVERYFNIRFELGLSDSGAQSIQ